MRCMMCENFSLTHICKKCQKNFLKPTLYKRKLYKNIELISFYNYDEIKTLLHTKHTDLGFHIYTLLAKLSFKKFAEEFRTNEHYISLAIDDTVENGYSHTAVLNKQLQSYNIKPLYNKIRSQNRVKYSGKSKTFRQQNKREFQIKPIEKKNIILVDDIATTGATLIEAIHALENRNSISFCLTLCDLSQKNN